MAPIRGLRAFTGHFKVKKTDREGRVVKGMRFPATISKAHDELDNSFRRNSEVEVSVSEQTPGGQLTVSVTDRKRRGNMVLPNINPKKVFRDGDIVTVPFFELEAFPQKLHESNVVRWPKKGFDREWPV